MFYIKRFTNFTNKRNVVKMLRQSLNETRLDMSQPHNIVERGGQTASTSALNKCCAGECWDKCWHRLIAGLCMDLIRLVYFRYVAKQCRPLMGFGWMYQGGFKFGIGYFYYEIWAVMYFGWGNAIDIKFKVQSLKSLSFILDLRAYVLFCGVLILGILVTVVFINIAKTVCLHEQHQKINR